MKHSVTEHRLPSGAKGLLINVPDSAVVNVVVRFNSGYQFAPGNIYEVPHVMEHLMATATQKYPAPNQFMVEAQKNGAYFNASTSADANGYVYECADFELERILDLLEEQLVRPLFALESLVVELSNVREELTRNTTQHGSVCGIRLAEAAYPGQALDYETRIGQLGDITAAHVTTHYEGTYTAANARFYVSGSFADEGAAIVARLERMFAQLPQGKRLERSRAIGRSIARPIVTSRDIKQIYYSLGLYLGELGDAERRALRMLRLVLTGGFGSRILGEARRRGLAYSVGAYSHAEKGNSAFGFSGYVTPEHAADLFELIARGFAAVVEGATTVAELTAAKDLGIGSAKRSHQTASDMLGWYMGPYDDREAILDFDRYFEQLREVTVDEVAAACTKVRAAKRHGLSLLGELSDSQAGEYAALLQPLWK